MSSLGKAYICIVRIVIVFWVSEWKDIFYKKFLFKKYYIFFFGIYKKVRNLQNNKVGEIMILVNDKIVIVNGMFMVKKNRCLYNNLELFSVKSNLQIIF